MTVRSVRKNSENPRKVCRESMEETRTAPKIAGLSSGCGQVTDVIGDFSDSGRSSTCCTFYRTESWSFGPWDQIGPVASNTPN